LGQRKEAAVAEKPGYWDVHRCAWVGTEPTYDGLPVPEPAADAAVPEQRPDPDGSLVAGTAD
jgi:hypothetical protein